MKRKMTQYLMMVLFICLTGTGCSFTRSAQDEKGGAAGLKSQESAIIKEGQDYTEERQNSKGVEQVINMAEEMEETISEEPLFEEYDISLMAVGDNLLHTGIISTGEMPDGTYNYSFLFDGIRDFLDVADVKIINQETILGGNELGFSGYPNFNSPTEVGDAIAEAGFNVVLQASNHSGDKGITGLKNCVAFWKKYPQVLMTGIHEEAGKVHEIPLLTIGEIDIAVLNYTYGPNLETLPSSLRGHLNMLCDWNESDGRIDFTTLHPQVLEDIREAEKLADFTIVCPHWGTEYMTTASVYQEQFAMEMTKAGADLIIGTHPHVVQPVEWIEADNSNRALCYYSLGNYVSTQKGALSMLEAMAWVTLTVKEEGVEICQEKTGVLPMVCHYSCPPVRLEQVYLLEDYTPELASEHGIFEYGGVKLSLEELENWSLEILGEWVLPAEDVLFEDKQ